MGFSWTNQCTNELEDTIQPLVVEGNKIAVTAETSICLDMAVERRFQPIPSNMATIEELENTCLARLLSVVTVKDLTTIFILLFCSSRR